ncbi:ribosomal RNA small subunit methyltransferase E [Iodidimonas gelatinilytica]|uniref:Ribosomal RNA small subunit methyltransferase E n=1 Tax=Iodidimonas gelatinilytica TaxID=1236966 RepID=A0A5A7MWM9_9PROT|nr:16S rRNA (uracil(1498)-N(3))-methyltransferase [Iodidimonas gelatinilytica]GEQ98968.1 ribosomal RNA small subunit methyltransferase E [Iodidimonas gelatinilytica]GEQ99743.1 ribosomal RNA small subunit methyltransferase E [Iodidimonas gelatinilytica]
MSKKASHIRLYVADDLLTQRTIILGREQAHYLVSVMRLAVGATVLLFNGRDGEWLARLVKADRKSAQLMVEGQTRPQSLDPALPGLTLLFAPVKRAKTDLIVEKATELGVARLIPVITERTNTDRVKMERFLSIAAEAAEQCERLSTPVIDLPTGLDAALKAWPDDRPLYFCDEARTAPLLLSVLWAKSSQSGDGLGPCGLLIGPEGGFTAAEREAVCAHRATCSVSLGARILRAETAAISALSLIASAYELVRTDLQ